MAADGARLQPGGAARLRYLPHAWALLLVALLLGPALGPGYVLSYDMVWVPHLAMRGDFLGLGTGLPRAVPSDAVVAALDVLLPGMLLQKLVLVAPLLSAAAGMLRLVGPSVPARVAVVTLTVWNPFVVERLWIGHWTVLVGYGVLPWLVLAGTRARAGGPVPRSLWLLLPLGSLSATAGLVSAVTLLVTGATLVGRAGRLRTLGLVALCLVANAPWVVAGLVHAGSALTTGSSSFALRGEGSLPPPLAALSLGGIWNSQVVPWSRQTFLGWIMLAVLVLLSIAGARTWLVRQPRGQATRLLVLWAAGSVVAVLTWLAPTGTAWLSAHVPGGGLLRDGARVLALCLPVYGAVPATGVEVLCRAAGRDRLVRAMVAATCAVVPVLLLYDAAWGVGGALRPVGYPAGWAAARSAVGDRGDVLVLPFTAYRAPVWNGGRTVLDPLGRYLRPDYVMNDVLLVDGRRIAGEDPRARQAARALALPDPRARAAALRGLGIAYVATERHAGAAPAVSGPTIADSATLRVQALDGPVVAPRGWGVVARAALLVAWVGFTGALAVGLALVLAPFVVSRRLRSAFRPDRFPR